MVDAPQLNGVNYSHFNDKPQVNTITAVIGAQWGDEGKGKIVDLLAQNADVVCRCQGGNNAGHTIVVDGVKYALHLLPSGMINPKCTNVIGNGTVIHVPGLFAEIEENEAQGMTEWESRLMISSRAHLVFDFHQQADGLQEAGRGTKSIGTTKKGVGPGFSSKATRNGIRMGSLVGDFSIFEEKYRNLAEYYMARYPQLEIPVEAELERYKGYADRLRPMVKETISYLHKTLADSTKNVLVECANAVMLDIDFGTYPMVTSCNCSAGAVCTGLGVPPKHIGDIWGVVKAYTTRIGRGPFPTELDNDLGELIQTRGTEWGVTTGRRRRCGWLDSVMLRYANMVNGFSGIALTKLDILDTLDEVKIAVAYKKDGIVLDYFPSTTEELSEVEVEYVTLPGWKTSTTEARTFDALHENAKKYVRKIEELTEIPIKWIGVGQNRDAIIQMY